MNIVCVVMGSLFSTEKLEARELDNASTVPTTGMCLKGSLITEPKNLTAHTQEQDGWLVPRLLAYSTLAAARILHIEEKEIKKPSIPMPRPGRSASSCE